MPGMTHVRERRTDTGAPCFLNNSPRLFPLLPGFLLPCFSLNISLLFI